MGLGKKLKPLWHVESSQPGLRHAARDRISSMLSLNRRFNCSTRRRINILIIIQREEQSPDYSNRGRINIKCLNQRQD
jgi:hypothetical protein